MISIFNKKTSTRYGFVVSAISVFTLLSFSSCLHSESPAPKQVLEKVALRGYGNLSAKLWSWPNGSILEINCENESKAKLTEAKYLSDLTVLPGVQARSLQTKQGVLNALAVDGQGMVAAVRIGNKVYLAASPNESGLLNVLDLGRVNLAQGSSKSEMEVPMWLDRWDRFGFRFYYRPWALPPDITKESDYDFTQEFEFAEKSDRSGFMFWAGPNEIDTAEGMSDESWWDWARKEAMAKKLPVSLNLKSDCAGRSWFYNRFRDQTTMKMPQFCGTYHGIASPYYAGTGMLSWNATTALDVELGIMQGMVRRAAQYEGLTTILEPHGELSHGAQDIFIDYGPAADLGFRKFLQGRYANISALNTAWGLRLSTWEEVKVPEVASFLGWSSQALDLSGTWHVGYETLAPGTKVPKEGSSAVLSKEAPEEWFAEKFDDSAWPTVVAPGHDRTMFLQKSPAVYRRTIDVPDSWLASHPRVWLYLWDLNEASGDKVKVALNGEMVGQSTIQPTMPHWGAVEVTKRLRVGQNQLSFRLPRGILAYRVYLSSDEPRQYPNLGKEGNARWVDYMDWLKDSRLATVRRSMEMIRQVDVNRQIVLMAPDRFMDGVRKLAVAYGGNFHNTGYMGGFWADLEPTVMRGARLPFCLEPGGAAHDLEEFKKMTGLYSTQGNQGIDYFIHIGDIMWKPDIRRYFEANLPVYKMIGKYHAPTAEVAALYSSRVDVLTGYPWGIDLNANLRASYWNWNVRANLMGLYESDGLTESSFADGDASRYRVVIDTNTSILDEKMVSDIEKYITDGGTFVTFVQTGRHTPIEKDSWPIARLTGFRVTHIDKLDEEGRPLETRTLKPAPGQEIFTGDWSQVRANGLTLEAVANDAKPLMLWADGSVAVGLRKLGKGYIVQVGCKFAGKDMPDRVEPSTSQSHPTLETRPDYCKALTRLMSQILDWQKVSRAQGEFVPDNQYVLLRHYLSNNGLYDVWTLWNRNKIDKVSGDLNVGSDAKVEWAFDVVRKEKVSIIDQKIPIALEPSQTRVFITPRGAIAAAPLSWLQLQRDWWRAASMAVPATPLPQVPHRFSVDIANDWSFKPLSATDDGSSLATAEMDDSSWEKINLGVWSLPNRRDIKHAILRKTFTVPESWGDGDITISLQSWFKAAFVDQGRIWLDGKLISDWSPNGISNVNPDGVLKAGSKHVIAVEIKAVGSLAGTCGTAWLWVWPKPESTIDLSGKWASSPDVLHYDKTIYLPGSYEALSLRREVVIPADKAHKNVMLNVNISGGLNGVLINGVWVRRFHHNIGARFDINITPWVKIGESNEIELVGMNGPTDGQVRSVYLGFYRPEVYP